MLNDRRSVCCRKAGDAAMRRRVTEDLAALQLRQREALNDVTAAAAAPSVYKPVRGEETRATRPMNNQVLHSVDKSAALSGLMQPAFRSESL